MKTYGVVMAGGDGTRFWPLSRQKTPKQLLNLSGKGLMINETIDRLLNLVNKEDIFVITNVVQAEFMAKATKGRINSEHILSEPCARNTTACIGYAMMEIIKKHGDGVMVITPSDSYIKNTERFVSVLSEAIKAAEEQDKLVTIGIAPTFPSIGYGYIKFDKKQNTLLKTVTEFKEKPDEETAKAYLSTGNYFWNSGIFIWKVSTILERFKELVPDIYSEMCKIGDAMGKECEQDTIFKIYPHIRKISVDYAIMEPSAMKGDVVVIPGDFGWSDVGSWDMMNALHDLDENGNVIYGDVLSVNSRNNIIYSSKKLVAVTDIENLIVVETPDAIMVCNKNKTQNVKLLVEALKAANRKELL